MRLLTLAFVATFALMVFADPVLAAAEGAHAESGKVDIKKDFGLQRYDLGIYTLIVFGILLFVLSKYAWPNIRAGLEKREANIRGVLAEAKKERADAEARLADAKKQIDAAAEKVKTMLDDARRDAEALRATERDAGAKEAAAERDRAKREIEATKDAMLKELYQQTVQLAAMISAKAIRRDVSTEDHRRLLDESIAELQASVNKA